METRGDGLGDRPAVPGAGMSSTEGVELAGVAKILAAATAISYVVGVFVTNSYLLEYKVADFDLLRPRLVFSGVVALFFPAAIAGMLQIFVVLGRWRSINWFARVLALLFLTLLSLLGPGLQLSYHVPVMAAVTQSAATVAATFATRALYAVVKPDRASPAFQGAFRIIQGPRVQDSARSTRQMLAVGLATLTATAGLAYLFSFARFSLPHIPVQYGGLASRPAVLVVADAAAAGCLAEAGVSMEGLRTKPVALIYEGQTYILIGVKKGAGIGNVIRVRKDAVADIVVTEADVDDVIDRPL